MLQEEPASQQSDCTTFQNALYDSFTFNTCAEKTKAIAFCHHAWRDTLCFKTVSHPCSVFLEKSSNVGSSFILNEHIVHPCKVLFIWGFLDCEKLVWEKKKGWCM